VNARKIERTRPTGEQLPPVRPPLVPHVEPILIGGPTPAPIGNSGSSEVPHSGSTEGPKYLTMERMDARLRPDQVTALAELRRRVNSQRTDRAERITDNTLVRVAVDLLLAHAERLTGNTEDELRDSVTTELP
jgi:hypothetical protein